MRIGQISNNINDPSDEITFTTYQQQEVAY